LVKKLVFLQRRYSNNLNQVTIHTNTYGGVYPKDIMMLKKDYADLWEPLSDLIKMLSIIVGE